MTVSELVCPHASVTVNWYVKGTHVVATPLGWAEFAPDSGGALPTGAHEYVREPPALADPSSWNVAPMEGVSITPASATGGVDPHVHESPFPTYGGLHVQLKPPGVLVHVACVAHGAPPHSSMSWQLIPSPVYPALHAQDDEPGRFVQVAWGWQPPLFIAHSSTSEHVIPLPVYPMLQAQLREPMRFVHVALAEQPPLFVAHSSMSEQIIPLPE